MVKAQSDTDDPIAEGEPDNPEPDGREPAVAGPKPDEAADAERKRKERERRHKRRKRRLRWQRAGVIGNSLLTVALVAATIANAYFVREQWDAMERTVALTNSLTTQAHLQASAALEGADAADRSARAAQAQVAAMREQFQMGQRPRLDIRNVRFGPPLLDSEGKPRGQRVAILGGISLGPGVAYRMGGAGFFETPKSIGEALLGRGRIDMRGADPRYTALEIDKSTVRPGEEFEGHLSYAPEAAWSTIELFGKRISAMLVYGWFDYCDSLDMARRETFCWVLSRDEGSPEKFRPAKRCAAGALLNVPAPPADNAPCH